MVALILLVALVGLAGALGGYVGERFRSNEPEPRSRDNEKKHDDEGRRFNLGLAFTGGPAGAFVALTFLSGPLDFHYADLHKALSGSAIDDFGDLATGFFNLIAVAIIGGYLGVRLVDKFAAQLLQKVRGEVRDVSDKVRDVVERVDVERNIREAERQIEQGLHVQAWETLKELPEGHVPSRELAWLRVLRGYALKRLDRIDEALHEVDKALEAKETYAAWYNRACYLALQSDPSDEVLAEIRSSLESAEDMARHNGGIATLHRHLQKDMQESGDLRKVADKDFIRDILQRTEGV